MCRREALGNPVSYKGEVVCIRNEGASGVYDLMIEPDSHCIIATGREKPSSSVKVCNCKYMLNQEETLAVRRNALGSSHTCTIIVGSILLLLGALLLYFPSETYRFRYLPLDEFDIEPDHPTNIEK